MSFRRSPLEDREHQSGWTVGDGVQYLFDLRWSAKLEYLYNDLDQINYQTFPISTATTIKLLGSLRRLVVITINRPGCPI
jgi:opacity protein-like surface antigen